MLTHSIWLNKLVLINRTNMDWAWEQIEIIKQKIENDNNYLYTKVKSLLKFCSKAKN